MLDLFELCHWYSDSFAQLLRPLQVARDLGHVSVNRHETSLVSDRHLAVVDHLHPMQLLVHHLDNQRIFWIKLFLDYGTIEQRPIYVQKLNENIKWQNHFNPPVIFEITAIFGCHNSKFIHAVEKRLVNSSENIKPLAIISQQDKFQLILKHSHVKILYVS